MKVGLLGTRHVHADGLAANAVACGAVLVGAAETDPQARAAWQHTPILERDELLEQVDAVIVAGTNRERAEATVAATRAGRPVLTEKPIAADAAALAHLVEQVDPALVMVALPLRFSAALQRAKAVVDAGAIGTPLAARGTNHGQFPGAWFGSKADAGGGALQDHVVHLSDGLCWLFDTHATRAYARASQVLHPDNDVEDCGIVTLDFADGWFASIDSSWSRPQSFATWGDVWLEIVGSGGRILIDPMATHLDLFSDRAGKLQHVGYSDDDMTRSMVAAFLDFARDGGPSPVPLADGVHASDTVLAAYASVASGRAEPIMSR